MATTLSKSEAEFLAKIDAGDWMLRDGVASAGIRSLIERGYCREEKARLGPLGVYTGEVFVRLTEAGRAGLTCSLDKQAASVREVQGVAVVATGLAGPVERKIQLLDADWTPHPKERAEVWRRGAEILVILSDGTEISLLDKTGQTTG